MVLVTRENAIASVKRRATVVQTITIRNEGKVWFATSEDAPTIFVSAFSREAMNVALAGVLTGTLTIKPPDEG